MDNESGLLMATEKRDLDTGALLFYQTKEEENFNKIMKENVDMKRELNNMHNKMKKMEKSINTIMENKE